ncbi:Alpha-N-arabinofuranosidase [Arthrobotrys entomopaga]|nr:Alpha-N-arabinofuranosidase [Arthrobotrys entomopaga]
MLANQGLANATLPIGAFFATIGPCDIYATGGTPCVAAHSTTRALYGDYFGPLYQVWRKSDGMTQDIKTISIGSVADSAAQDAFCPDDNCYITIIYDQSGLGNHLTQAQAGTFPGPEAGGYDSISNATAAPIYLDNRKVYGVYMAPGFGYRKNQATGTATGDDPQGMYAVFDATHYNAGCCFDYGNGETSRTNTGNGHMEAIYFGSSKYYGGDPDAVDGPRVMADLENGVFASYGTKENGNAPTIPSNWRFVTATLKGGVNRYSIKGADATAGGLTTYYNGERPKLDGYNPMSKEGSIVLGIGGDNSNWSEGTFYEGVMTTGYPADTSEDLVQANIVAAKYGTSGGLSVATVGSSRESSGDTSAKEKV